MIDEFTKQGFGLGRLVGWSKTQYRRENPDNEVYFNANIFNNDGQKVWYGDLDLTVDGYKLQEIADKIGTLYVLWEHDGRFYNEAPTLNHIKEKAVKIFLKL